jgi:7-cyano-7-deazaguanine synthase
MKKAVVLLSGGLDSATVAALAIKYGYEVLALSFDYGQLHKKELNSAKQIVKNLGIKTHKIVGVDLSAWGGSALTDKAIAVPRNNSSQDIPSTYVPGRNTVFISLALSFAEVMDADSVFLGVNAIDYSGYPDCRPEYIEAIRRVARLSSKKAVEGVPIEIITPLLHMTKVEIVRLALRLKVFIPDTWSCYQGGDSPCGVCDSCLIRNKALQEVRQKEIE